MSEIRLTKEYMDNMIINNNMIPLDFEVSSCNQQIHYMDKDGYKYNYSWSQFKHRINKRPIQKISQSNIYSIENIKLYLKLNKIDSELLSNTFTKVTDWNLEFSCSNCGKPFVCSWNKFKRRKYYFCDECLVNVSGVYKDRKNKEDIITTFNKIGLTIKNIDDYIGSNKNIECYDKDGYKYFTRYGNVTMGKFPSIVHPTNPYSIENIKKYLILNNSKTILLSDKYVSERRFLEFECGECRERFSRSWSNMNGSTYHSCEKCQIVNRGKTRRISIEQVLDGFERMELTLLDYNYVGNNKRLLCEDKFGYRGFVSYNSQQKVDKSSRTGFDYFSLKHNRENFIYNGNNYCKTNGYKTEVLAIEDEQIFTTPTIKCKCECGEYFITSINSFKSGKLKCDKCSKRISKYEQMVFKYFKDNKIKFTTQKKFNDCRNILPLPFDFYIKDKNILIEVDGQGHYEVCCFNQCSRESGEKSFKLTQSNDKIKTKYCIDNNIQLIRIPYWDLDSGKYIEILNQSILNLAS